MSRNLCDETWTNSGAQLQASHLTLKQTNCSK